MKPQIKITTHAWERYHQRAKTVAHDVDRVHACVLASVVVPPPPRLNGMGGEYWHDIESGVVWVLHQREAVLIAKTCLSELQFIAACDNPCSRPDKKRKKKARRAAERKRQKRVNSYTRLSNSSD